MTHHNFKVKNAVMIKSNMDELRFDRLVDLKANLAIKVADIPRVITVVGTVSFQRLCRHETQLEELTRS